MKMYTGRTLRQVWAGLLLMGLLAAAVGCKESGSVGGATGGAASTSGDILIGHYASITGGTATFGKETQNGVDLAVKEINTAGGINGRKIRVETQDDQSKVEEAKTVATKFASEKDMVAVVGEVASSRSMAAGAVLQQAGVPMVTPSSTNVDVTKIGDYIFRCCFIDPFQGYAAAKFAAGDLKTKRAAVLIESSSDYSDGLAKVFKAEFPKFGGEIIAERQYRTGDSDFHSQLQEIKKMNPDVIFIPGYYGEVGTIARQARELGMNIPLLGGDGWDSPLLVSGAGGPHKALEGCYFTNHASKDEKTEAMQKFVAAYKAKYNGAEPSGLAALGYDTMRVVADAIKRAGSTDHKAVRDALAQTKDFPGVTGKITMDANRNPAKQLVVLQIKGTQFVYRQTIQPSASDAK